VGSAAYVEAERPSLFLSDKLWQLTFEAAEAAYMHYWTQSDAYRSQLRGLSVGASSSMQNLSYGDFLSITIAAPPIHEQVAIVARLDRVVAGIADAVETARRGVELARERRAALISAAVTGKIDVGVAA
jgi:type I restriction enzyme S subunit